MLRALSCGVLAFPGLFCFLRKFISCTFKTWTEADVVLVSERLVSTLHAVLASTAGLLIIKSCKNVMTDRHWLSTDFVWFGVPYMSYDIYAMYLCHYYNCQVKGHVEYRNHSLHTVRAFLRKDFLLVLHHTVLLTIFLPITLFFRRDLGDFFVGCLFTTEFSTPFICLGQILIQLGLQASWLHRVNGVMALLSFFTCRVALFPYMYWAYGRHAGIPFHSVPFHLPLCCNLGNLCILAPQLYWFTLLCRKARRLYLRQAKPKSS
ncbi:TLC domain-containing protein 3A-like [Anguilla rostrata]|uniref:TLC domain-containing protein 3A-like n=1 Tax=Anguilla rostrata TaxID=7938 RepID=UPI0030CE0A6C